MDDKYVLVRGNLSDGFQFEGPFDDFDAADEDMRIWHDGDSWIATLYAPCVDDDETIPVFNNPID